MFTIVRYKPLVFPVCDGSLKCSTNISIQKNIKVFVDKNEIKEIPIRYGFEENINPIKERILINKNSIVSFLFPKFFRMFTLLDSKKRASTEESV
jgi:Asp-tRNA(Asn)/Glu-tRNA(Gln) amidotransferase B subunit